MKNVFAALCCLGLICVGCDKTATDSTETTTKNETTGHEAHVKETKKVSENGDVKTEKTVQSDNR